MTRPYPPYIKVHNMGYKEVLYKNLAPFLKRAIKNDDAKTIYTMAAHQVKFTLIDKIGFNPLTEAIKHNCYQVFDALKANGAVSAPPGCKQPDLSHPYYYCGYIGALKIFDNLINNLPPSKDDITMALRGAAHNNHIGIIYYLEQHGFLDTFKKNDPEIDIIINEKWLHCTSETRKILVQIYNKKDFLPDTYEKSKASSPPKIKEDTTKEIRQRLLNSVKNTKPLKRRPK